MNCFYKFLICFSALLLLNNTIKAVHIAEAEISYRCIGANKYIFTLQVARDCNSGLKVSPKQYLSFYNTCDSTGFKVLLKDINPGGTELSQICPGQLSKCKGGIYPGITVHTFSDTVILNPSCNSWLISYSTWDNGDLRNSCVCSAWSATEPIYIVDTLNTATLPCATSPIFTSRPVPYRCVNQPVTYNLGVLAFNKGTKLKYSLVDALVWNDGSILPYDSPYSGASPIPGITINDSTGTINFTPKKIGNYIVAVKVSEYDKTTGKLIGTIARDMEFIIQSCTNLPPRPEPAGQISKFTGTADSTGAYAISMCPGNSFSFKAVYTDPNATDSLSITSNITTAFPGATITTSGNGKDTLIATISWTAPMVGTPRSNVFTVFVVDNKCPIMGEQLFGYTVNIKEDCCTNAGPDITVCGGDSAHLSASGGDTLVWSILPGGDIAAVLSCDTCSNPAVKPSVTTTFVVKSNLISTCNKDTVVVNVLPNILPFTECEYKVICKGDSTTLDVLSGGVSTSTYKWLPATGLSNPNIKSPIAKPSAIGNITYTVTVNNGSCATGIDSVKITVNALPTVDAGINTAICKGGSTILAPTPTTLKAYSWSTSATGLDNYTIQKPTAKPTTTTTYTLTGTNNNGCKNTDTIIISIQPTPTSTFKTISPVCSGSNDTITYTGNGGSTALYKWRFGTDSTIVSGSGKGPYIVKWSTTGLKNIALTVTENGCSSDSAGTVTVNLIPTSPFTTTSPVCSGSNSTITYTGNAVAGDKFIWKIGADTIVIPGSGNKYQLKLANAGTINLTLVVNNGCTSNPTTVPIVVNPIPDSTFTIVPSSLCARTNSTITYTGNVLAGASYIWGFDGGTLISGTGKDPQIVNWASPGTKKISLKTDANNCSSNNTKNVTVSVIPPAPDVTVPPAVCQGASAGSLTASGIGGTLNWYNDSLLQNLVYTGNTYSPVVTSNTTFWITETTGCTSPKTPVNVVFFDLPNVSFEADSLKGKVPLSVVFTNTSSANATKFLWYLENAVTASIPNPSHTYTTYGTYNVTLIGTTDNGCIDTAQAKIIVDVFSSLEIPNVFTPNGDNVNDVFKVKASALKEFNVIIYNRWGLKIYEWINPDEGWDGLDCEDGTYYYIIRATGLDDAIYNEKGFVLLISKKK